MARSEYQSLRQTQSPTEEPTPDTGIRRVGVYTFDQFRLFSPARTRTGSIGVHLPATHPVWIDIRPRIGLETAHAGRLGRRREQARFATFGPKLRIAPNTAFQSIRI